MPTTSTLPPGALHGAFLRPASARARRKILRRIGGKTMLAGLALLGLLVGLFFAAPLPSLLKDEPVPAPAPRAVWLDIVRPYPLYQLSAPQFFRLRPAYSARRHSSGGGREDALTFGEFDGKTAFLRLSLYRHGGEWVEDPPFFVDMARRAAPLGLSVEHQDLSRAAPSRFGEFETAELGLAAEKARRDNCLGFRLTLAQPGLTISGLACGANGEAFAAENLGCMIKSLDLIAAGDDRPLRDFFAAALLRPAPNCPRPR